MRDTALVAIPCLAFAACIAPSPVPDRVQVDVRETLVDDQAADAAVSMKVQTFTLVDAQGNLEPLDDVDAEWAETPDAFVPLDRRFAGDYEASTRGLRDAWTFSIAGDESTFLGGGFFTADVTYDPATGAVQPTWDPAPAPSFEHGFILLETADGRSTTCWGGAEVGADIPPCTVDPNQDVVVRFERLTVGATDPPYNADVVVVRDIPLHVP